MIKDIEPGERSKLETLLVSAGLPANDIDEVQWAALVGWFSGKQLLAAGGLEKTGEALLLRSVVTLPDARGRGLAGKIVASLHQQGHQLGYSDCWLLTTDAKDYFSHRHGYQQKERAAAPLGIQQSGQFSQLCPSDAILMQKPLLHDQLSKSNADNPVLAEVIRGGQVESRHRGSVLVVDAHGNQILSAGDFERYTFPRSSLKFLQAIPLVESGAADAFQLSDREIALACASHNAESIHVDAVGGWLQRLQLEVDDLECGPTLPLYDEAAHALIADGRKPTRAHQNCSGKHAGMLTVSRHLGEETSGYSEYTHPSQQAWMKTIGEIMDLDLFSLPWERDGCGLPAVCMPLSSLAKGFARLTEPSQFEQKRGEAIRRILSAVSRYPEMIAGSGRCCTAVIQHTEGKVLVKTGAEGVFAGCIPEKKLGFALKIDDGATRASEVALGGLLAALGVLTDKQQLHLKPWFEPAVINSQGKHTGIVRAREFCNRI